MRFFAGALVRSIYFSEMDESVWNPDGAPGLSMLFQSMRDFRDNWIQSFCTYMCILRNNPSDMKVKRSVKLASGLFPQNADISRPYPVYLIELGIVGAETHRDYQSLATTTSEALVLIRAAIDQPAQQCLENVEVPFRSIASAELDLNGVCRSTLHINLNGPSTVNGKKQCMTRLYVSISSAKYMQELLMDIRKKCQLFPAVGPQASAELNNGRHVVPSLSLVPGDPNVENGRFVMPTSSDGIPEVLGFFKPQKISSAVIPLDHADKVAEKSMQKTRKSSEAETHSDGILASGRQSQDQVVPDSLSQGQGPNALIPENEIPELLHREQKDYDVITITDDSVREQSEVGEGALLDGRKDVGCHKTNHELEKEGALLENFPPSTQPHSHVSEAPYSMQLDTISHPPVDSQNPFDGNFGKSLRAMVHDSPGNRTERANKTTPPKDNITAKDKRALKSVGSRSRFADTAESMLFPRVQRSKKNVYTARPEPIVDWDEDIRPSDDDITSISSPSSDVPDKKINFSGKKKAQSRKPQAKTDRKRARGNSLKAMDRKSPRVPQERRPANVTDKTNNRATKQGNDVDQNNNPKGVRGKKLELEQLELSDPKYLGPKTIEDHKCPLPDSFDSLMKKEEYEHHVLEQTCTNMFAQVKAFQIIEEPVIFALGENELAEPEDSNGVYIHGAKTDFARNSSTRYFETEMDAAKGHTQNQERTYSLYNHKKRGGAGKSIACKLAASLHDTGFYKDDSFHSTLISLGAVDLFKTDVSYAAMDRKQSSLVPSETSSSCSPRSISQGGIGSGNEGANPSLLHFNLATNTDEHDVLGFESPIALPESQLQHGQDRTHGPSPSEIVAHIAHTPSPLRRKRTTTDDSEENSERKKPRAVSFIVPESQHERQLAEPSALPHLDSHLSTTEAPPKYYSEMAPRWEEEKERFFERASQQEMTNSQQDVGAARPHTPHSRKHLRSPKKYRKNTIVDANGSPSRSLVDSPHKNGMVNIEEEGNELVFTRDCDSVFPREKLQTCLNNPTTGESAPSVERLPTWLSKHYSPIKPHSAKLSGAPSRERNTNTDSSPKRKSSLPKADSKTQKQTPMAGQNLVELSPGFADSPTLIENGNDVTRNDTFKQMGQKNVHDMLLRTRKVSRVINVTYIVFLFFFFFFFVPY